MINNIQFLRFVAASLVIFAHAPLNAFGVSSHAIHLGGFGVDIFFIISGFIIPYILFGASHNVIQLPKMGGVSFFVRRIVRIWPLYLVATIFVVLTALFVRYSGLTPNFEVNNVYGLAKLDWKMLFESLTFTHAVVAPTLNVGWTLQLEFLFYTAVAIILLLGAKSFFHVAISYTFLLLGSALLLGSTGATFATYFPPVKLLATPMMIEFLFGLILYGCYLNGYFLNKWLSAVLMLLIVPVFYYTELHTLMSSVGGAYNRVLVWGTFAFIIVWAAISLEPHYSMPKIFNMLGDASYSLYLTHWLVLPWITLVINRYELYPKIGLLGLLVICFFVCQFVALLTHFFIEKPLNEKVRRVVFLRGVNRIGVQPATVV